MVKPRQVPEENHIWRVSNLAPSIKTGSRWGGRVPALDISHALSTCWKRVLGSMRDGSSGQKRPLTRSVALHSNSGVWRGRITVEFSKVQTLVLPLTGHTSLGKSLNHSESVSSAVKWEWNAMRHGLTSCVPRAGRCYAPGPWLFTDVSFVCQSVTSGLHTLPQLSQTQLSWWSDFNHSLAIPWHMVPSVKIFLFPACHNKRKIKSRSPR